MRWRKSLHVLIIVHHKGNQGKSIRSLFFSFLIFKKIYVYGYFACMYVWTTYMQYPWRLEEGIRFPPPAPRHWLGLQMVLSNHVGTGNWTQVLCENNKFS